MVLWMESEHVREASHTLNRDHILMLSAGILKLVSRGQKGGSFSHGRTVVGFNIVRSSP